MTYIPPTLEEVKNKVVTFIESKTNQKVPSYERAFKRVLANALSLMHYPIYHYTANQRKQCFAISSSEESLDFFHGPDEGIERGGASKCEVVVELEVSDDATVTVSTAFQNESTGLFYFPKIDNEVTDAAYTITLIADGFGTEYALQVGDVLKNDGNILNVGESCEVISVSVYPEDKEEKEEYRRRIIQKRSGSVGGGNAYDYRATCEGVTGVRRAFVFPGRPDDPENSKPGDRSVFIEMSYDYGTDGIASESLLSSVRTAIRVSPEGLVREQFGSTDGTLYVSSVSHVLFNISITGLVCDASIESALKKATNNVLSDYLKSLAPYCFGVDPEYERRDNVSSVTVSEEIGKLLRQYSATAAKITVVENGVGEVTNRLLVGGETARLNGSVSYVA